MVRRFRPFGDREVGDVLAGAGIWLGAVLTAAVMIFMFVVVTIAGVRELDMYFHGVRAIAMAVSTRSASTLSFTEIGFVANGDWRVAEIPGAYAEGEKISIIYDADDPSVVDTESQVGIFALLGGIVIGLVLALFLVAGAAGLYSLWENQLLGRWRL